jgi:5-methylcytosine-specific restriction enzyme A
MPVRPCIRCGQHTANRSRCDQCETSYLEAKYQARPPKPWYTDPTYRRNRAKLLARAQHCEFCGTAGDKQNPLTADHLTPVSRGGTNNLDNLRPLCRSCNSRRGNR